MKVILQRQIAAGWFVIILMLFTSCRTTDLPQDRELHYFQHEPLQQVEELEPIVESVNRILVSTHYDTYRFDEEDEITLDDIKADSTILEEADRTFDIETRGGTAIMLDVTDGYPLILTTNHVIDQPDTVATHYEDDLGNETGIAELIINDRVQRYIPAYREIGELEILVSNSENDVAFLTGSNPFELSDDVEYLNVELGSPELLDWGSKVFTIGYPLGNEMLSTAMVSEPDRDGSGGFLIDALFNPGFSGGAILAINNDDYSLELVGMARSASADAEFYLRPARDGVTEYDAGFLYEGPMYLEHKRRINYGIVQNVSVSLIKEVMEENRSVLEEAGFDF